MVDAIGVDGEDILGEGFHAFDGGEPVGGGLAAVSDFAYGGAQDGGCADGQQRGHCDGDERQKQDAAGVAALHGDVLLKYRRLTGVGPVLPKENSMEAGALVGLAHSGRAGASLGTSALP